MRRTVLLVEDDSSVAEMIEIALESFEDISLTVLPNGIEALNFLAQHFTGVAALITDLHMPVMSGFELIEHIRAHEIYDFLPIVVVSSDTNPETAARLNRFGISAYFAKPFSPLKVRRKLELLVRSRHEKYAPKS